MGATFSRIKTWIAGETLTASDQNAEFDNILNNFDPDGLDDASANNAAMDAVADPYPGQVQSLATALRGELQRKRFVLKQITGEANWYIDPDTDLATAFAHYSDTTTHGTTGDIVGTTDTQTLSAKTLTTPIIGDFTNATHDHIDTAGGGILNPLQTEIATTSGTEHDFTSIPSWVKKITIMFAGVSTDGTSIPIIQLGDSGGFETSGYIGTAATLTASTALSDMSAGFIIDATGHAAGDILNGTVTLTLEDSANFVWTISGVIGVTGNSGVVVTGGYKALTAALTQIRLTTTNGTDAFDAGGFNVMWE